MENKKLYDSKILERIEREIHEEKRLEKEKLEKELYELEKRYYNVDERLEKEKTKRNLILISVYTIFSGFIISRFFKITDIKSLFFVIFFSLLSGVLLWIVPLSVFSSITDSFTNINNLEDSKKYLAEEIKRIKENHREQM